MKNWKSRAVPIFILLLALFVRIEDPQPIQLARWWTFDTYQRIEPRAYEALPVRILDIDDESLARIGQWPWPRTRIAELVGDGSEGLLYDPADPRTLDAALVALTDATLRRTLGQAARARAVSQYSWHAHCAALDTRLRQLRRSDHP